ncbi:MAG: BON domain-containing protein [Firmicutes bacterium]|nr:BON domain-containing protein [Bacillota bacterium]
MANHQEEETFQRIVAALDGHPSLRNYDLHIQVKGDAVHLQGIVDVLADKELVEGVVRAVPKVGRGINSLTISTDGKLTDEDVLREVEEELAMDLGIGAISPKVKGGVVYLHGEAKTLAHEKAAVWAARKARGVREVVSRLSFPGKCDNATLKNRIERALRTHPQTNHLPVRTAVRRGSVVLQGTVIDQHQKRLVEEIARSTLGVRRVINQLELDLGME